MNQVIMNGEIVMAKRYVELDELIGDDNEVRF